MKVQQRRPRRRGGRPKGDRAREAKRGRAAASRLGHTLTRWKRRAYAPSTAATACCKKCRATALVNLEHASDAYGPALTNPWTDPPA